MAVGLRAKLYRLPAIYMIIMFQCLLSTTDGLHKFLQRETVDFAQALQFNYAAYDTLREKCTDEMAEDLYKKAKAISKTKHIQDRGVQDANKRRWSSMWWRPLVDQAPISATQNF
ncbi:hypothetical protein Hamer_G005446 [Homarus americanus]|uniref:Uncharacterized protein n=1 Tax=Homarus americanus TaxID=6706 RepID=A0A8J5K4Y0_HOMAM|nr:hypothetical protein Hamer_G005446 [Homarus americanus]